MQSTAARINHAIHAALAMSAPRCAVCTRAAAFASHHSASGRVALVCAEHVQFVGPPIKRKTPLDELAPPAAESVESRRRFDEIKTKAGLIIDALRFPDADGNPLPDDAPVTALLRRNVVDLGTLLDNLRTHTTPVAADIAAGEARAASADLVALLRRIKQTPTTSDLDPGVVARLGALISRLVEFSREVEAMDARSRAMLYGLARDKTSWFSMVPRDVVRLVAPYMPKTYTFNPASDVWTVRFFAMYSETETAFDVSDTHLYACCFDAVRARTIIYAVPLTEFVAWRNESYAPTHELGPSRMVRTIPAGYARNFAVLGDRTAFCLSYAVTRDVSTVRAWPLVPDAPQLAEAVEVPSMAIMEHDYASDEIAVFSRHSGDEHTRATATGWTPPKTPTPMTIARRDDGMVFDATHALIRPQDWAPLIGVRAGDAKVHGITSFGAVLGEIRPSRRGVRMLALAVPLPSP